MGLKTQPVACLYEGSKFFLHRYTHTHTTWMKCGVGRVMDTLIVVLADRLPVLHCYDANHQNTTVFKAGSNAHTHTHMQAHILLIYSLSCKLK